MRLSAAMGKGSVVGLLVGLCSFPAYATKSLKPHVHGAVKLGVAIDGNQVSISGEIPGHDTFGFEHDAHNDQQRQKIRETLSTLRTKGAELFVFPSELGCTVKSADIKSSMEASLTTKTTGKSKKDKKAGEAHQDVDAVYVFTCKQSPAGSTLRLGLFKKFPTLRTITVEVLSDSGQSEQTVKSAEAAIKL